MNCQLFFAYGTLRRGFSRHKYLEFLRAQYLSRGAARGKLFNLGDYPGAVPSTNPADFVVGEVYRLPGPARALKLLDEWEGIRPESPVSGLFRREIAEIELGNGTVIEAWIYWLNRWHNPKRRIRSGDYTRNSG